MISRPHALGPLDEYEPLGANHGWTVLDGIGVAGEGHCVTAPCHNVPCWAAAALARDARFPRGDGLRKLPTGKGRALDGQGRASGMPIWLPPRWLRLSAAGTALPPGGSRPSDALRKLPTRCRSFRRVSEASGRRAEGCSGSPGRSRTGGGGSEVGTPRFAVGIELSRTAAERNPELRRSRHRNSAAGRKQGRRRSRGNHQHS